MSNLPLNLSIHSLRRLVRRMTASWNVIHKEWFVWCCRVQITHVPYGFIRQIRGEVVVFPSYPWIDLCVVAKEIGLPLIGLATQKSVKILETHT